jgi:hypothetical protein
MKKIYFLLFLLPAFSSAFAQSKKNILNDTLVWRSDYRLVKEDFQGKVKKDGAGLTSSGIIIYTKEVDGQLLFYVEAFMAKNKSYLRDDSKYVLNHEQMHFDITEIFARELRKKLAAINFMKIKNIQEKVGRLYEENMQLCFKEQDKYDNETEHGLNMVQQDFWNNKIAQRIAELEEYANTEVKVTGKQ